MRAHPSGTLAALAAILLACAAVADDDEILAHYDAYDAAFSAGRFAEAAVEAEAAWRAAEAEWGAVEETAVLAFNLTRLKLMLDERAEAVEPALRVTELLNARVGGGSIAREEAVLLAAYAQFDPDDPSRDEIEALAAAAEAFTPSDATGARLSEAAWYYVTKAYIDRRQWRQAYETAEPLAQRMAGDGTAPIVLGGIAGLGVKAAYEMDKVVDAVVLGHVAIAAFPPQPPERPIDPVLGSLLGWDAAMHNLIEQRDIAYSEADYPEPNWSEGRYPTAMGCSQEWIERPPPPFPPAGLSRGQVLAMLFEYYLDADGAVIRVEPVGAVNETGGFADAVVAAMRGWRMTPQPRAECRGPWSTIFSFQIAN